MMTTEQAFAQGARCGHIEGKGRVGLYVNGEEELLSEEAASGQDIEVTGTDDVYNAWARGYRHGYRRAASGEALEEEYKL